MSARGPEVHVSTRTHDRVCLRLAGEFDCASRDRLAGLLHDEIDAGRHLVQLDLSQVSFVDGGVVGVFAAVDARCRQHDTTLVLVGAQPPVRRVLALCGLENLVSTMDWAATPA